MAGPASTQLAGPAFFVHRRQRNNDAQLNARQHYPKSHELDLNANRAETTAADETLVEHRQTMANAFEISPDMPELIAAIAEQFVIRGFRVEEAGAIVLEMLVEAMNDNGGKLH